MFAINENRAFDFFRDQIACPVDNLSPLFGDVVDQALPFHVSITLGKCDIAFQEQQLILLVVDQFVACQFQVFPFNGYISRPAEQQRLKIHLKEFCTLDSNLIIIGSTNRKARQKRRQRGCQQYQQHYRFSVLVSMQRDHLHLNVTDRRGSGGQFR